MFDRLLTVLAWTVIFFLIAPLFVIVAASFTETSYVTFPPQGFTLKWYRELAAQTEFFRSFVDSVVIGVATMAGAALIGIPTAFGLRLGSQRSQAVLRTFVMSPLTLPGIVTGVALLQIYYAANLDAPLAGIIVGHILVTVPFFVRTLGAGLEAVDPSILEAAESLGATRARVLWRVLLPSVLPSICAGLAFVFITSFDEVTMSIFFSNPAVMPLPIKIFSYIEFSIDPIIAALSTILILFAFLIVTGLQQLLGFDRAFRK